jgi:arylsulfatase A-like enzyme
VYMVRTDEWKLNVYGGEPGELYNLKEDPQEFYNRIDDPACADTIQALSARLKEWETANR